LPDSVDNNAMVVPTVTAQRRRTASDAGLTGDDW